MLGEAGDATVQSRAVEAGVQWVRLIVEWGSIEPIRTNPPTYDWSSYDTLFAQLSSAGFSIHAEIRSTPYWAAEDVTSAQGVYQSCGPIDPEDLPAFAQFVQAFVERYDGDGLNDAPGSPVVSYIEFWNEADAGYNGNTNCDWVGGCWGGDRDNDGIPDPQEYATMLSYAYPAVKAANPETRVLFSGVAYESNISGGCFNMNFTDQVLTALEGLSPTGNAGDYFDLMNFHQYDFRRGTWDGASPDEWGILGKARAIRDILARYGLGTMPMVVSEIGLSSNPDPADPGQDLKASHLVREFVRALSVWPDELVAVIWFPMVDCRRDNNNKGLLQCGSLTPYKAYEAYKTLTSELAGYAFDQRLTVPGNERIQAYRFCIKEGDSCVAGVSKKLVLWRDERGVRIKSQSTTATESMRVSASELGIWTGKLRVVDKLGNEQIIDAGGASSVNLTFTISPIFVEAVP